MPLAQKPHSALLILCHGSSEAPEASRPYLQQAENIRLRNIFAEVHCAFLKEKPTIPEALAQIRSPEIYLLPAFMSEGYFTQHVIPRQLQLTGPTTVIHGKTLHYCQPIGCHPSMAKLILHKAEKAAPHENPALTTLLILGHGTTKTPSSARSLLQQISLIEKSQNPYASVQPAFMEEPPLISDWLKNTPTDTVIAVPFFMTDGPHSLQEIPELLGLPPQSSSSPTGSYLLDGKKLYYTSAIGTDPSVADLMLDQILAFQIS